MDDVRKIKQINSDYKGDHKSIFIVPIGDIHFGNRYYNAKYLNNAIKFLDKNRARCRVFLMGDLLEVATKTSVGRGVYDEQYPTQRQYEKAIEVFKPYGDIVESIVEGNHEERIIRDTSFEIIQEFSRRINAFNKYTQFESVVNIKMGSGLTYSVNSWHGATGGTRDTSAINGLLRMRENTLAHIYLMGHTHKLLSFEKEIFIPIPGNESCTILRQMFVNTGTSLGYGGYGAQKGLGGVVAGFSAIEIFRDERRMVFHKIDDLI